ncbi:MAG: SsrA-binding protein SmpB [Cytophagaceae bacterium]|jgi:SsrA-binding protein|nr:SsrA-binding protein SmpB [Cytophagaceae bacterium]
MSELAKEVSVRNKKATFEFEIVDTYTAGIVLKGTEIKSIRLGKVSIAEAYCFFEREELWVKGMNISVYDKGTYNNHEPLRTRKLLLQRQELIKLERQTEEKGLTIIPLKLFSTAKGLIKLDIALARGKKVHDKRASIKEKDIKRELDRHS